MIRRLLKGVFPFSNYRKYITTLTHPQEEYPYLPRVDSYNMSGQRDKIYVVLDSVEIKTRILKVLRKHDKFIDQLKTPFKWH